MVSAGNGSRVSKFKGGYCHAKSGGNSNIRKFGRGKTSALKSNDELVTLSEQL